jgi:hypothetical protein
MGVLGEGKLVDALLGRFVAVLGDLVEAKPH